MMKNVWTKKLQRWTGVAGLAFALAACGGTATDTTTLAEKQGRESSAGGASKPSYEGLMARGAQLNEAELKAAVLQPGAGTGISGTHKAGTTAVQKAGEALVAVYRFYNSSTSAHFYTADAGERDHVIQNLPVLSYEGPAFHASAVQATALSPVYRFFNTQTGVHFYTISEDEKNSIIANLPQFSFEGPAYFASKVAGQNLLKPLFRFYVLSKGFHFYTADAAEAENIKATIPGYRYEGIAYYVLRGQGEVAPGKIYKGLPAANHASAAIQQASAEGASGYTYFTDFQFSNGTQQGAVYFTDTAYARTYFPVLELTFETSASGKAVSLSLKGDRGLGYQGDVFFFGNGMQTFTRYVSATPGAGTMSYITYPMPATVDAFSALLNGVGATGYRFLSVVSYGGNNSALFESNTERPGPFEYRLAAPSTSVMAFEDAANAQGNEGFAFKGGFFVGGNLRDIYARDGGRYAVYRYKTEPHNQASSMATVIDAVNVQAAQGYYWFGTYSFGGTPYSIHYKGNYVCHPLGGCAMPDGL